MKPYLLCVLAILIRYNNRAEFGGRQGVDRQQILRFCWFINPYVGPPTWGNKELNFVLQLTFHWFLINGECFMNQVHFFKRGNIFYSSINNKKIRETRNKQQRSWYKQMWENVSPVLPNLLNRLFVKKMRAFWWNHHEKRLPQLFTNSFFLQIPTITVSRSLK